MSLQDSMHAETQLCNITGKGSIRKNSDPPEEEEIHKCSECEYTTQIKSYLSKHLKSKHAPLSIACDSCGKKFRKNRQLKLHELEKHSGIIFKCDICTYKSPRSRDVNRHNLWVHDKTTPDYTCGVCGFVTKYKQTINDHQQSQHDDNNFYVMNVVLHLGIGDH